MSAFPETLEVFWKLQALDVVIVASQREIAKQRGELQRAQARTAVAAADLKRSQDGLDKLRAASREDKAEIDRLDARIRQLEEQSGTSTSEAQIKNVAAALVKERAHLDERETESLERLEAMQAATASLDVVRGSLKKCEGEQAQVAQQAGGIVAAQEAVVAQRMQARAQITPALEQGVLEQYEVANRQNPGEGICLVDSSGCMGCSGELTQQQLSEVRARNQIVRCPNCHRILDWKAA